MTSMLTPRRRRGIEILDDPAVDPELMKRSMADVEKANILFGGTRAALAELRPAIEAMPARCSMLDVGTGRGDIPTHARLAAAKAGVGLWTIGLDAAQPMVSAHRGGNSVVVRGDALRLPCRDRSVDIVMASQVLHHFETDDAVAVVREMNRVARSRVVISDLRRSAIAASGLWIVSFALGFHRVSRHDGVVSVMRGFLPGELADIVEIAVGHRPAVHRRFGFRLTTSWIPQE